MRTMHSLLLPLAAAFLVIAARPVDAQQFTVASNMRSADAASTANADIALRTVAIYRFGRADDAAMPSEVTVSDSVGTLVASYRLKNSVTQRPMIVEPLDDGLLLQADTQSGVLTLFINQPADHAPGSVLIGTWFLGGKQGELLRRAPR